MENSGVVTFANMTPDVQEEQEAVNGEHSPLSFFELLVVVVSCAQLSHTQQGMMVSQRTMRDSMKTSKNFMGVNIGKNLIIGVV
ncbi:MAG: hypothetical protein H6Q26_845 [Bacteroidetes bacterium]|nr:hypothetical protein [Bacteroidota bacterium]